MANLEDILGKKINSVKELREEIKRLQDSLVGVDGESQQFKTTSQQLAAAQDELRKVTKASSDENLAAKDSIVGMQQEYKKLYDQYKLLSEEQRNSSFGKNMAAELEQLSTKLNDTKKDVGNFKDNIGRYANDVTQVFQTMGISIGGLQKPLMLATGGVKTLSTALKSLIANPVGAIIMAIVVAFKAMEAIVNRVREAINNNEESQMRLKEAMASFQPIIDGISNAFDWLGQRVVDIISFFGKLFDTVRRVTSAITDFLGITKDANKRVNEQINTYKGLAKAQNELVKTKRKYNELNAKDSAEVERLREEASETQNLADKKKLLEQAKEKQGEIDARNIELAKEELKILETQDSLTANNTEENEKLSQAKVKVANAEANAAKNARQFNKQLNSVTNSTKAAAGATDKYKKALELAKSLIEENKTEIEKLSDKYKKEKELLEKYNLDTTLLTNKYEKEKREIVYKSLEKQRERRLKELQYSLDAANRYRETLIGIDVDIFDKEQTEGKISSLKKLRDEANNLYNEWLNTNFLFPNVEKYSKEWYAEAESVFADLFKNGNFENFDYPLSRIKEIFDEAGVITGDDIIDIQSIELNIKILENDLKSLNDSIIGDRIDFKLSEQEVQYYENAIKIREDETLSAEESAKQIAELDYNLLIERKNTLKEELDNFQGSQELKLQIMQRYYDTVNTLRENELALENLQRERDEKAVADTIESISSISSAFETVRGSIESIIDSEVESGKITEQQAKKKKKALLALQAVETTLNVISIAGSTASGIMKVWQAFAAEKVVNAETATATGPALAAATLAALNAKSLISAIAQTAGLAATGAANIAAAISGTIAKSNSMNSDDGGGSVSVSPQMIDSTPYSYTRTVQTQEEEEQLNRPVWVSVQDIESGLEQSRVRVVESSF